MPTLDKETRQLINAARTLGAGGISMYLSDADLLRLCALVATDLEQPILINTIASPHELQAGYYGTPLEWFQKPVSAAIRFDDVFLSLKTGIEDFATYFKGICELHKRRLKFKRILENQPIPQMEQIVPRCLLEYGLRPSETLASWLVWRKWLYDIDNRSAQETGYLFEPILAAAIGGVPYSASKSPIRRADDPRRGRQVDCLDGKEAHEFKMRVTIAASGQGRFQEEIDFARDCHESGYIPILLVLDPTPSARLDDLIAAYAMCGGRAYTGNAAWDHIVQKAGRVMGRFVEKYVRTPLREIDAAYSDLQPIQITDHGNAIMVQIGDQAFSIERPRAESGIADLEEPSDHEAFDH